MTGVIYRFVPAPAALDAFFERYETERRRLGVGTTLAHVSPQQRIDTLVTILGLNAAGGWRRRSQEGAESVWLRYLTPVLAETRETVAALAATAAEGLPGQFEPAIPVFPSAAHETEPEEPAGWASSQAEPGWEGMALALERGRSMLHDIRVLAALAIIVCSLAAGWLVLRMQPGPADGDVRSRSSSEAAAPGAGASPYPAPDQGNDFSEGEDMPLDEVGRDYRSALALTLSAAMESGGSITPLALAEVYAGESGSIADPATFLTAMIKDWPLPAERPIPRDRQGAYALTRYAATFAALEREDPVGSERPALDRRSAEDGTLRADLLAFAMGDPLPVREPSPAPTNTESWPGWLRWLAFLPLAGMFVLTRTTVLPAFRAQLANPPAGTTGVLAELPVESLILTAPRPARRLVRQISWREPGVARRIHAEASVRTTIRRGGFPTVVLRRRRRTSEFVFLVPRLRHNDHERDRVGRLIEALQRGGLSLAVYDYDPDPRTLYPRAGGEDKDRRGNQDQARKQASVRPVLDLRALRERHAEARLVLVTDGSELVDYFTQRPLPFVAAELAPWPTKMLLTPVPMAEWGEREMNLSEALGAVIGRAGAGGFADLAVAFGDSPKAAPRPGRPDGKAVEGEDADLLARLVAWIDASEQLLGGRPGAARRPAAVRFDDPLLRSDAAPPDADQQDLVNDLRAWLGPRGFMWLCACAAYPQLRFAITLYLGLKLVIDHGPVRQPLYDEALLAQLTLLPWFRVGRMPPWLRRALFSALHPPVRQRIRKAVDEMLRGAGLGAAAEARAPLPDAARLPIWRPDGLGLEVPPDAVMAELLFRERSDLAPVLEGGAFSAIFNEAARRARQTTAMLLGATLFWCLIAFFLWPALEAPPVPGEWLPLASFVIATTVIGAVVALARRFRRYQTGQSPAREAVA